jgi:hypothetical protein
MDRPSRTAKTIARQKLAIWTQGDTVHVGSSKKDHKARKGSNATRSRQKRRPAPLPPIHRKLTAAMGPFKTLEEALAAGEEAELAAMEAVLASMPDTPVLGDADEQNARDADLLESLNPAPLPFYVYPKYEIPTMRKITDGYMKSEYPAWAGRHLCEVADVLQSEHHV